MNKDSQILEPVESRRRDLPFFRRFAWWTSVGNSTEFENTRSPSEGPQHITASLHTRQCIAEAPNTTCQKWRLATLVSGLIVVSAILIHLLPDVGQWSQYDRTAISTGQVWRLATCHLTHWSFDHLFWDIAAFVVLAFVSLGQSQSRFLCGLAASVVLISVSLWFCLPHLETYRGLSGIDSALFTLVAATILRERITARDWLWVSATGIVLAGFVGKVAFEQLTGATLFVDSASAQMVPIPLAHVVGGIVGAACGLLSVPKTLYPSMAFLKLRMD